jgi:two-component system, OmpR family, response regulator
MKKKILLVEDEEMLLRGYSKFMEKAGYDVVKASDGYKGLDILEKGKDEFCIFILDLMIPGIDGLEVLRLKEENRDKYGNAPVLVLTNMTSERVIKEAFDLGAVSYLIKNEMPMESLVDEVNKIVGE